MPKLTSDWPRPARAKWANGVYVREGADLRPSLLLAKVSTMPDGVGLFVEHWSLGKARSTANRVNTAIRSCAPVYDHIEVSINRDNFDVWIGAKETND